MDNITTLPNQLVQNVSSINVCFHTLKIIIGAIIISFLFTKITKQTFFPSHDSGFQRKMLYSVIHILIMCIVPTILLSMNIMKFSDVEEHIASRVALYWISLDAVYALIHFSQHKWFQNTHKEHHDMDIFPGYSFVYSPIDSICVQLCMQSPFYFGLRFSKLAWSISMFCLVFCGIMAHAQYGWIDMHVKHHKRPHEGRYSFTGFPEHVLSLLK